MQSFCERLNKLPIFNSRKKSHSSCLESKKHYKKKTKSDCFFYEKQFPTYYLSMFTLKNNWPLVNLSSCCCSVIDALYVRKTLAVNPGIKLCKYLFSDAVCNMNDEIELNYVITALILFKQNDSQLKIYIFLIIISN